jgi:arylsulfatase A-like enzyme
VQDIMIRVDRTIGTILAHLDRTVGAGRYVVAFSADHGASPIPQQAAALGLDAGRLDVGAIRETASKALATALGPGQYAVRVQGGELILDPAVAEKLRRNPAAVEGVISALRAIPGVAAAYFGADLEAHTAAGDPLARATLLSFYPGRSGDIVVVPKPYWLFVSADGTPQPGSATSHGTAYSYDQRVPLMFLGAGIKPGEYLAAASPADIAPTLAFLCGVTLPRADGSVLADAIAPANRSKPAAAGPAAAPIRERAR